MKKAACPQPPRLFDLVQRVLQEIAELCSGAASQPTLTVLPRVLLIKGQVPDHQLAAIYEPCIGLVVQGAKIIAVGGRTLHLRAPAYFVIPVDMPATGRVLQGANGLPYLSVGLQLDHNALFDLLNDLPEALPHGRTANDFSACAANADFLNAWLRMLRLLRTPEHIPGLAPAYEREILYHVLSGPEGWRLRRLFHAHQKSSSIVQAIQWVRKNYLESFEVSQLADRACMGLTTFHRRFKQITGLTPIQFQKQLRLLEARKLLAFGGYSATDAALKTGYESVSQFNREYSRFFGASPRKDAAQIQRLESEG